MWAPAVNNEETFGRWAFLEIRDPWDAEHAIRNWLTSRARLYNAAEAAPEE